MENMHKVRAGIMRVLGIVITCLFAQDPSLTAPAPCLRSF